MHYQRMTKEEQYQDIVKTIVQESAYKRKESSERKYMSVHDMGDLLGIRKTDRYWLVHKGFFKTEIICGKMMVEIASFEKWYANQVKYHKVNGEEPGQELKKQSYSARDIAEILDIAEWKAYKIMNDAQVEFILVDYWKRYPKEAFDRWYQSQNVYQNSEDKKNNKQMKDDLITMPEMARLLGVDRHGMPTSDSVIRNALKALIKEHDLPPVVFHSLRHTSVTYKLKLNGGDIKAVQGDSGHSQINMVTDVYSHIIDDDRKHNAELFEQAFYNKGNLDPNMKAVAKENTVELPTTVDAELLAKVLSNPEMAALISALAKGMEDKKHD